jgi:polyisoprenoid-binding protein YceI
MRRLVIVLLLTVVASPQALGTQGLDLGFRQMYSLDFVAAHQTFSGWMDAHPRDPLGPASDAAAYLFAELDRLRILRSQFLTSDQDVLAGALGSPDIAAASAFSADLAHSRDLAASRDDENSLFASALCDGLEADYQALIAHHNLAALRLIKHGQAAAQRLLATAPDNYDAQLALGFSNYILALKPAPIRWLLRLDGISADLRQGIAELQAVAAHGHYLRPYAEILLAIASLRAHDSHGADVWLEQLALEFPGNPLYRDELDRLAAVVTIDPNRTTVHFTLGAFLHTVHGTMPLAATPGANSMEFDPRSGAASGLIAINAAAAATGNGDRDRNMREHVLETDRYPTITFAPDRLKPLPLPAGDSDVTLHGTVTLLGAGHVLAIPAHVHSAGGQFTLTANFSIPYVAWGLHNPSTLLLRVGDTVKVAIKAQGSISRPPSPETRNQALSARVQAAACCPKQA